MEDTETEAADAETVLSAPGDPIVWEKRRGNWISEGWEGTFEESGVRRFRFTLSPPYHFRDDFERDADGLPLHWKLHVRVITHGASLEAIPVGTGIYISRRNRVIWEWEFPCRTLSEAKAICRRVVTSGDFTEVDERDAQRHLLHWSYWNYARKGSDDSYLDLPGEERAVIQRRGFPLGFYRISRLGPKPTTKQTAELADSIDWASDATGGQWDHTPLYDKHGNLRRLRALYAVSPPVREVQESLRGHLEAHHVRKPCQSPFRYDTEADAKAACARYHQAGGWDLSDG